MLIPNGDISAVSIHSRVCVISVNCRKLCLPSICSALELSLKSLWLIALLCFPLRAQAQTGLSSQWIAFNRASAPNSNLQCFKPRNVSVSGGNLVITTKSELAFCSSIDLAFTFYRYTSGYVSMRNFNFLYGTVEFRAKFGGGAHSGSWPVVWMEDASCQASDPTGTDSPCNGQEIDIAEILDSDFEHVNQQIHVDTYTHNDGCKAPTTDTSQNFHVFQLVWSPGELVFKIDGTPTCTIIQKYVPHAPMYLKIDNFVGKFGGPVNNHSLPWTTLVDYVKVTQGSTVIFEDDFNPSQPYQSLQPVLVNPSLIDRSDNALSADIFRRWQPWALVICFVVLSARIVLRLHSPRNNRGKKS
jgi:beta-glucanase (GH16 family)